MKDTLISRSIGNVQVTAFAAFDEYGDQDLGTYCNYELPSEGKWLMHVASGSVLGSDGLWRHKDGRLAPHPEVYENSREYQFIMSTGNTGERAYEIQDMERLVACGRGDWYPIYIKAEVEIDGRTIGDALVGGYASDDAEYLQSEARSLVHEALSEARNWLGRNCQAS